MYALSSLIMYHVINILNKIRPFSCLWSRVQNNRDFRNQMRETEKKKKYLQLQTLLLKRRVALSYCDEKRTCSAKLSRCLQCYGTFFIPTTIQILTGMFIHVANCPIKKWMEIMARGLHVVRTYETLLEIHFTYLGSQNIHAFLGHINSV